MLLDAPTASQLCLASPTQGRIFDTITAGFRGGPLNTL